ncbi:MAG: sterol desaturase family protein [Smithellaceae bacterium]|jgi:sterol desaturase/sphingolipid hydroxylase (fatty acid hydroxylase superfamily)
MIYDGTNFISPETFVRLGFFAGIFSAVALGEKIVPRRMLLKSKTKRWIGNLGMQIINVVVLRLIFPLFPVGIAVICAQRGWGLLNYYQITPFLALIIAVAALDFVIYLQHRMFHVVPLFWPMHMVHHTDQDIDVTTALRFHPLEIILSMLIKFSAVAAIGAPPLSVLIFEIMLNGATMFNHGNVGIPLSFDRMIRMVLVTPDMHRVHHSVIARETNSNYGFSFPWWDRMLGTYRAQPQEGHDKMKIGLNGYHDDRSLKLAFMLAMPFSYPKRVSDAE